MHTVVQSLKQIKLTIAQCLTYTFQFHMFKAFFSETQRKLIKFLINTEIYFYFILSYFTGVLAGEQKSNCLSAAVVDHYTLVSAYICCSCTQLRSTKLLFGSQNSRGLNTINFWFLNSEKMDF